MGRAPARTHKGRSTPLRAMLVKMVLLMSAEPTSRSRTAQTVVDPVPAQRPEGGRLLRMRLPC